MVQHDGGTVRALFPLLTQRQDGTYLGSFPLTNGDEGAALCHLAGVQWYTFALVAVGEGLESSWVGGPQFESNFPAGYENNA